MKWKYLIIFLLLVSIFPLLTYFYFRNRYQKILVIPNQKIEISPSPTPTPDPNRPFSILLLGYAGYGHDGGFLTDSIILAKVNPKIEEIDLISLPRDLWVKFPETVIENHFAKINSAYAVGIDDKKYQNKAIEYSGKAGGGQLLKFLVSEVTGINPDYFIAIDFTGFIKAIDRLGGIDVNIPFTYDDEFYPLDIGATDTCDKSEEEIIALSATLSGEKLDHAFTCRYEHLHLEKGIQHLDGATALKYARSRHSLLNGGDFNRSERQKIVLDAVKKRVISLNFFPKIIPLVNTLSYHLVTDIDLSTMESYLLNALEYSQYKINSKAITDKNYLKISKSSNGQSILIPKLGENNYTDIQDYLRYN